MKEIKKNTEKRDLLPSQRKTMSFDKDTVLSTCLQIHTPKTIEVVELVLGKNLPNILTKQELFNSYREATIQITSQVPNIMDCEEKVILKRSNHNLYIDNEQVKVKPIFVKPQA